MGQHYDSDYHGVLDWIVDGQWESTTQGDDFASVIDEIDVPNTTPEPHNADTIEAYDAFIAEVERALDKYLGEDQAAEVVVGEGLHGAVVEVWHTLEGAGVGVWDGDWERDYGVDGDRLAEQLGNDKKLYEAYQRLYNAVDYETYERMTELVEEHLGEQRKESKTRKGRMRRLNRRANQLEHVGGGCHVGPGSEDMDYPCTDDFVDSSTGKMHTIQTTYDEHFSAPTRYGGTVDDLPKQRLLNAARGTKWCIIRAVFTDTNDYGFVTWHVAPWNASWEGLYAPYSNYSHAEGIADEFGTMAQEAHDDVGWAKWALEDPWDSGAIDHAGDGHYYNMIYPSMDWDSFQHEVPDNWDQMDTDEQQEWAEQYDSEHGSLSVHLQVEVIGCYEDPNDAFKVIWNDHNFGIGGKAKLWNYDYDDKGGYYVDEEIDPYDVAKGAVEIEFDSGVSPRKRKMRKLNKAETRRLKNRLMKG